MKKAIRFSIAVCLFSWAVFGILYAVTGGTLKDHGILFGIMCIIYMVFPLLTALFLQWKDGEKPSGTGLIAFRPRWSWLAGTVIPLVMLPLIMLFSALVPGTSFAYSPEHLISMFGMEGADAETIRAQFESVPAIGVIAGGLLSGIFAGLTINAVFAFGEEYGWRNYMVHALKGESFIKAALTIGIVWGIWHAPLILMGHNYPQHPVAGVPMMVIFCILVGFIELYLVKKTGSVYPAAIFHGTINAIFGFTMYFIQGGNDLTTGSTGAAGFVAIAVTCLAIFIYDRYISKDHIISSAI